MFLVLQLPWPQGLLKSAASKPLSLGRQQAVPLVKDTGTAHVTKAAPLCLLKSNPFSVASREINFTSNLLSSVSIVLRVV